MASRSRPIPQFCAASDRSLLLAFGNEASQETSKNVHRLTRLLLDRPRQGIINIHPAYSSVLISVDPCVITLPEAEQHVRHLLDKIDTVELPHPRSVELPVCYEGDF